MMRVEAGRGRPVEGRRMKSAKKWMVLLAAAMAWASLARADTESAGGVEWTYEIADGAATVTGASPARTAVEIPSELGGFPVRTVGDKLFDGWSELASVSIPEGVTRIGGLAFYNCGALREVVIPDSVEHIGWGTFFNCGAMTNVVFGRGVKDVDHHAFLGCSSLKTVCAKDLASWCGISFAEDESNPLYVGGSLWVAGKELEGELAIPDGVERIGISAFRKCVKVTSVTLPDSVREIGNQAFNQCFGLTNVVFGNGVTNIGVLAFSRTGVISAELPGSLKWLGGGVFYECALLTNATLPEGLEFIGGGAFTRCAELARANIPGSVTNIDDGAFEGCSALTEAAVPPAIRELKKKMFSGCAALTNVSLPEGLRTIGEDAFKGCAALGEVSIPGSVTAIRGGAFEGCGALETVRTPGLTNWCGITFGDAGANPLCRARLVAGGEDVEGTLAVPEGVACIGARAFCGYGGLTAVSIPAGVGDIGAEAFGACGALEAIEVAEGNANYADEGGVLLDKRKGGKVLQCPSAKTGPFAIPPWVGTVGDRAFSMCAGLTEVSIPGSVTNIEGHAFEGCGGLTAAELPPGLAGLGEFAFSGCKGLTAARVPGRLASIGVRAFNECSGLTNAVLEEGVSDIGNYAFAFCGALEGVSIPSTVTNIGYGAFLDCRALAWPALPDGLKAIGNYAFDGCSSLKRVALPPGVTSIKTGVFLGCRGLESVSIPEGVTTIGTSAFESCVSLKSVTIPASVGTIGNYAFENCSSLTALVVPHGVTKLGTCSFNGCSAMTMMVIPASVTKIGAGAFSGCGALARVYVPASWRGSSLVKSLGVAELAVVYGEPPEGWETAEAPGAVEFSPGAGAWPEAGDVGWVVSLAAGTGAEIYYTLDGSRPVWADGDGVVHWSAAAQRYSWPVRVRNGRDTGTKAISGIMTGRNEGDAYDPWYAPAEAPAKIPVLRAAAVGADGRVGETATATYLPGDAATRYGGTPVVSLCAEWADLFDNTNGPGIYRHPTADNKTKVPNAHVEYFEGGERRFAKWCELRAQGGTTLGRPKKSLRLTGWAGFAPDGKGKKEPFDWPFFGEAAGRKHSAVVLRMGGNDWNRAVFRDRLAQEIGADGEVDGEAGAVCALFLDGVYWGVHELRERHDSGWFRERLGLAKSKAFSLLEYGDQLDYPQVNEGWGEDDEARTSEAYADFWGILRQLEAWNDDLSDAGRWAWFTNRVNPDSLAVHFAASLFTGNSDWPWNNQQWWRAWPDGAAGAAVDRSRPRNDGRWNWTFHDMDFAFALPFDYVPEWSDGLRAAHDSYAGVYPGEGPYVGTWVEDASRAFRAAMTNPGFRERFLARVYLRLATDWSPGACVAAMERVAAQFREAGMDENGLRWRQPQTAADWERQVDVVRGYLRARPEAFAWHTRRRYGLGAPRTVALGTDGEGVGSVRVAGRAVGEEWMPLTGAFPRDLPLELEAVPAKGSAFAGWFAVPGMLPEKPGAARAEDCLANYTGNSGWLDPPRGFGWGPWAQEGGWVFGNSSAMPIHGRSEDGRSFGMSDSDYGGVGSLRRELADGSVLAVGEEMSLDVGFGLAGGNGGAGVSFTTAGGEAEPVRLALAKDEAHGEAFRLTLDGEEFIAENFPHLPGAPMRVALARTGETAYELRLERGGETFGTKVQFSGEITGLRVWKNRYGDKGAQWTVWFDNLRVGPAAPWKDAAELSTGVLRPVAFLETGADFSKWSRVVQNRASVWVETSPLCNIGTPAFGMGSGEGSEAVLRRRFGFALTNGYELSFDFQNNSLLSGSDVGAAFLTEDGTAFEFAAVGGSDTYRLRVPGGEEVDTGVPLVKTGVHVSVRPREEGGVTVTVANRSFALDVQAAIDGIEFFDRVGGEEKTHHVFFNRVVVRCDPGAPLPDPPPAPDFFETGADRANWTIVSNPGQFGGWAGGGAEDSRILGESAFYLYAGGADPRDTAPFAEALRTFPEEMELGAGAVLSFRFAHGWIGDESPEGIGAVGWNLLDADRRAVATFSATRDADSYLWNGDSLDVAPTRDTPHEAELRFLSDTSVDFLLDGVRVAEATALDAPVRGLRFWNAKAGSGQERNLLFNDIAVHLPAAEEAGGTAGRRVSASRGTGETLLSTNRVWTLVPSNDIAVVARFVPRAASDLEVWAAERGIEDPWGANPETGRSHAEEYLLETNAVESLHGIEGGTYQLRFSPGEHGVDSDIEVTETLSDAASWRAPGEGELVPLDGSGRRFAVAASNAPPHLFVRLVLRPVD
jgi:hypothetical protein